MTAYRWSEQWQIERSGDDLRFNAGADLLYTVSDIVEPGAIDEVSELKYLPEIELQYLTSPRARAIAEELVAVGILMPVAAMSTVPRSVNVQWVGDRFPQIEAELERLGGDLWDQEPTTTPDLVVYVRTNAPLRELAKCYSETQHLLVDLAYHHTISLGPLVFPGDTACLRCFANGIAFEWGDPTPPQMPRMSLDVPLIAVMLDREVTSALNATSSLVGRSVSYDFDTHSVVNSPVYKRAGCPHCDFWQERRVTGHAIKAAAAT